ncbi:MAG: hypothetical protein ACYC64_12195 [Armatimonadota bacterium]
MNLRTNVGLWLMLATMPACTALSDTPAETEKPSKPQPRQISVQSYTEYSPLFATRADTLDPLEWSRQAWKGYMSKQPDPWGMTTDGKPTLRYNFDNRVLPWPRLKHHGVDGFDNNARNVGAHALLHEMLGAEKKNDPAEAGQMAYLLGCTDPESGFAYSPDTLPRHCPLGEGEMARNIMLLYQQTGDKYLFDWASRMIKTLRYYAILRDEPGVGSVAAYCQGGNGGQGGFIVGEPPVRATNDSSLGGWQHLYVGWATGAFSKWYELTGDKKSLDFAVALANRLCNSEDPDGNDGSFRPDGSFGTAYGGSAHMHGHTHCLPGLIHLGGQLIKSRQQDKGLRFIGQAKNTFDWLYDPTRNPDAGAMTGWLGEWLATATGWLKKADCEGCTMGDVVQTAVALGAASRLDPSLGSYVDYYDRAEQIYTGQLVEQTFRVTPAYLKVVKVCLVKRVDKDMPQASSGAKAEEVEIRYEEAVKTAGRMVGQQLGVCGFPDWVNVLASDLDPDLPGIHMQGCCADATIRASHAIWSETVTGTEKETRVNLAFNRKSPLVDVVSCLPHRGELDVFVKTAEKVLVRVPSWAPKEQVKAYADKKPYPLSWDGQYVVFANTKSGSRLTVTYPLRIAEVKETPGGINGITYTEKWRGNTIVDISPKGKYIPIFNRPELESEKVP